MEEQELNELQPDIQDQNPIAPQMSVGEWLITLLILAIPLVNFIMMFVWAFDPTSGRRNFARAYLILTGAAIALSVLFIIFMFVLGISIGILGS